MLTDEWIKKYDTYHKSIYLATHTQYIILYSTILSSLRKEGNLAICDNLQGIIFWAHGDFSYEIKRCLLLVRKTMTNMDSVLKSRDITLPTKVCLIKAIVFPVVMYGCKSWTIKKAERWRIDASELQSWRRLLRVPWTARKSNQSVLKKSVLNSHWKNCCWSWNSNTLVTWCEELTPWKRPWCWERLRAGGEGDDRGWDGWMASLMRWTWVWASSRSCWWTGKAWYAPVHSIAESWTRLSDWTGWTGYCAYSTRTGTCGYNSDHRDTESWISLSATDTGSDLEKP